MRAASLVEVPLVVRSDWSPWHQLGVWAASLVEVPLVVRSHGCGCQLQQVGWIEGALDATRTTTWGMVLTR